MHVALVFLHDEFYTGLSQSSFDGSFDFYSAHFCNHLNRSGGIFDKGFGGDRMSILKSQTEIHRKYVTVFLTHLAAVSTAGSRCSFHVRLQVWDTALWLDAAAVWSVQNASEQVCCFIIDKWIDHWQFWSSLNDKRKANSNLGLLFTLIIISY